MSLERKSPKNAALSQVGEAEFAKLVAAVGQQRAVDFARALVAADEAIDRSEFGTARREANRVLKIVPGSLLAHQLAGSAAYYLGKWSEAIPNLEWVRDNSKELDLLPMLADCYRAQRKWSKVEEIWNDIGEVSPNAEIVAEARIVMAGSLADQGKLREAIKLLDRAPKVQGRPKDHHLRIWYALADLEDRAGNAPRARELFERVVAADPDAYDASERLALLG